MLTLTAPLPRATKSKAVHAAAAGRTTQPSLQHEMLAILAPNRVKHADGRTHGRRALEEKPALKEIGQSSGASRSLLGRSTKVVVPENTLRGALLALVAACVGSPLLRLLPGMGVEVAGALIWANIVAIPLGGWALWNLRFVLRAVRGLSSDLASSLVDESVPVEQAPQLEGRVSMVAERITHVIALLLGYWIFVWTLEPLLGALLPIPALLWFIHVGGGVAAVVHGGKAWTESVGLAREVRQLAAIARSSRDRPDRSAGESLGATTAPRIPGTRAEGSTPVPATVHTVHARPVGGDRIIGLPARHRGLRESAHGRRGTSLADLAAQHGFVEATLPSRSIPRYRRRG